MKESLTVIFGAIVLMLIALVYATMLSALIVYCYYQWFMPIVFPTVNYSLSFSQAIAASFLISLLKNHTVNELDDKYKDKSKKWLPTLVPYFILGIGWVVYLFIK